MKGNTHTLATPYGTSKPFKRAQLRLIFWPLEGVQLS
jgi:hypothetical protein